MLPRGAIYQPLNHRCCLHEYLHDSIPYEHRIITYMEHSKFYTPPTPPMPTTDAADAANAPMPTQSNVVLFHVSRSCVVFRFFSFCVTFRFLLFRVLRYPFSFFFKGRKGTVNQAAWERRGGAQTHRSLYLLGSP